MMARSLAILSVGRGGRRVRTLTALLLTLLAPLAGATNVVPVPLDPLQALSRSGIRYNTAFGEVGSPYGLYLLGSPVDQVPGEVSLWRFDGEALHRIPLPPHDAAKSYHKPCGDCFIISNWSIQGADNDIYVQHFLKFPNNPPTIRWWWSDGFTAHPLTPHPALDTGTLRRVGGKTYLRKMYTLYLLEGREDRITPLVELPPEVFANLSLHHGELRVFTLNPQTPDTGTSAWWLNQWAIRDGVLQPLASVWFRQRPSTFHQVEEGWYIVTETGELWQVLDGMATPVSGVPAPEDLTVIGEDLYLSAETPERGREPYRVRGLEVFPLGDLVPGPDDAFPHHFNACGERVCFAAGTSVEGRIWWTSDGFDSRPLGPGLAANMPDTMPYNGALYFTSSPPDAPRVLYRTGDGETVEEVARGCAPEARLWPRWLFNASLYVNIRDCDDGTELYRISDPTTPLVNLSVNTGIEPLGALTPGFIVTGNGGRFAILGEAQYPAGKPALHDPVLTLRNLDTGAIIDQNDNWGDHPAVDELLARLRAPAGPRDAALVVDLPPGRYAAELREREGGAGQALISIQQLDGMRELLNISANTRVSRDGVTPGFVVQGAGGRFAILGEAQYHTGEPLPDPVITVRDLATGTVLGRNDDWRTHPTASELVQALRAPTGERDAALLLDLPLGAYVVDLRDGGGHTGQALLSIQRIQTGG